MRSERWDTPEPIRLLLEVPAGRIAVETADVSETEVELAEADGSDASRDLVERARIELRGDELRVVVPDRKGVGFALGHRGTVDLRVRCPDDSHLEAKSRSADIVARGRYSGATINTVSGDVELGEVTGDLALNSISGDARLGPIGGRASVNTVSGDAVLERVGGALRVNAVSGDVTIRDAAGPVKVDTISGDLELESVERGEVALNSVSGDLRVGIKRGSRLGVDATAVSGDLDSEIELADAPGAGPEEGPVVEVRARSISGDLRIVRA